MPDIRYGWNDPKVNAARELLERVLNDVHWRSEQRYHKRRIIENHTRKVSLLALVIGTVFLAMLLTTGYFKLIGGDPFTGIIFVLGAGLLGAIFSVLTNTSTRDVSRNLEDLLRTTSLHVTLLRMCVGSVGALILYFFFEAQLVDGMLFPDLKGIGFSPIVTIPDNAALADLLARTSATVGVAPERAAMILDVLKQHANPVAGTHAPLAFEQATQQKDLIAAILDKANATPSAESVYWIVNHLDRAVTEAKSLLESDAILADEHLALIQASIFESLGTALDEAARAGTTRLGLSVPNADLSKLMIWSFLAGFSEQLVARMLGKVEVPAQQ